MLSFVGFLGGWVGVECGGGAGGGQGEEIRELTAKSIRENEGKKQRK